LLLLYALPIEAGIGAAIGLIGGLIYVGYKLTTNWRQWKDDIENADATRITYQDISDLEQYVCTTYDTFIDLKAIILDSDTKKTS
jgi:hypothetical protein